ncbi:MAG: DUF2202 domain-containing protein [Spirochaetales bacterium]|nr:DUF2202 domain-containing protein [Spirochaetales bacterium]
MNKMTILLSMVFMVSIGLYAEDFGSAGAKEKSEFTLEEMLEYAIQDEYLALNEYQALMDEFGVDRPYSNIARSEETHISYLEELYRNHNISIPRVNTDDHIVLPSTLQEAAEIGVQAEINNIAMYEQFLAQDLPDDVREVFVLLQRASENHLQAFERQAGAGTGQGRAAQGSSSRGRGNSNAQGLRDGSGRQSS